MYLLGNDQVGGCHLVEGEAELAAEAEAPAVDGAIFLEDHCVLLASLQLDHLEIEALLLGLGHADGQADLVRHVDAVLLRLAMDGARWLVLLLAEVALGLVLALTEGLDAREDTELKLIVLAGGEDFFELHVEGVTVDVHDELVEVDVATRRDVLQLELPIRVGHGGKAHARDSHRGAHHSVVQSHLRRVDLERIRIARYDLHGDLGALVVARERLPEPDGVKVGQVAVHQDQVLLREDEHRLVQVLEHHGFPTETRWSADFRC